MDTECYVALTTGRHESAVLVDRVSVTGDTELAARVIDGMNVLF